MLKSTLNLIDLAGSESAEIHLSKTGDAARSEMRNINRSLLALTTIINKLSYKSDQWIPYRDSKLTKYLEDSFQGKAKIAIICNLAPGVNSYDQSQSTIMFASMAKRIKQNAKKNRTNMNITIAQIEAEVNNLKNQLIIIDSSNNDLNKPVRRQTELSRMQVRLQGLITKINSDKLLGTSVAENKTLVFDVDNLMKSINSKLKEIAIREEIRRSSIIKQAKINAKRNNNSKFNSSTNSRNTKSNFKNRNIKPYNSNNSIRGNTKQHLTKKKVPFKSVNKGANEALRKAEIDFLQETIDELQKQLDENEEEKGRLECENDEYKEAEKKMESLIENISNELVVYRKRYGKNIFDNCQV